MARDCSERFMWETDQGNIMQQLREFRFRTSSQPPLQINVPRRSVKVPHQKSKKIMELLSKPRDRNASPSLLMIAPPSDERYRSLAQDDFASRPTRHMMTSRPIVASQNPGLMKVRDDEAPMWPNIIKVEQNPIFSLPGSQLSAPGSHLSASGSHLSACGPHLSAPCYLQQLSRLAAMAWSDCTKVTEKLRRIYEQTTSLTARSFHSNADPCSLYRSPLDTCNIQQNPSTQPADYFKMVNRYSSENVVKTSSPSQCACVVCHVNRRVQPNVAVQGDVTTKLMTSYVVTNDAKAPIQTNYRTMAGQTRSRLKRALSPTATPSHQPPIKKLITSHQQSSTSREESAAAPDALSSSFGNNKDLLVPPQLVSNIFLHPSLQMTSSSFRSCDVMVTPVFDHPPYMNPNPYCERVHVDPGACTGFNDIFPRQLPNAIK